MCDLVAPKSPEMSGLDEEELMPSGWSPFDLGTQRSQSPRSFPAPWLRRLGFPLLLAFFVLSFILSIITLTQVFQNQRQYNSEQEVVQEPLNHLSDQLKGDQDLRAKDQPEASLFIEQLNKTLNLRAKDQLEASQLIEQLNKTLTLRAKDQLEASQLIEQLNKTLTLRAKDQLEASQFIEELNKASQFIEELNKASQVIEQLSKASQFIEQLNKTLSTLCRPCPYEWKFYKDSCYYFSVTRKPWEASQNTCEADGSNLVIISSSEEQNYLKKNAASNHQLWVGLSDKKKEGYWHWVDGTALGQSFWNEGEPNNAGDEDCCELIPNGWNDASCSKENYWICEKKASPCPML
ncbi:CD209 antigen-like protein B isoform X3 [Monodelphis domestica]|uniref:CD209 antigen-like protein B isoform X2 n=1 Tax=Monodelphis domestica TaxID=13616 RepID=UPI0024E1DD5C|nr:CD209 antigen-like protein B isoform X2 [Monodelphis domestica]XP_056678001.1 CD209 antigen-like protein B isoform X3 [Monodelphis domestica]